MSPTYTQYYTDICILAISMNAVHENGPSAQQPQVDSMKILGIRFINNNKNIIKINLEPKTSQLEKEIAQWRRRNISPIGRITVIKSLLISKLVHIFTSLPNPSKEELKHLENILHKCIWASKRDPIKRSKTIQNYSHGGLRMLDLLSFVKSMKISWLKRLRMTDSMWGNIITDKIPIIHNILTYGSKKITEIRKKYEE